MQLKSFLFAFRNGSMHIIDLLPVKESSRRKLITNSGIGSAVFAQNGCRIMKGAYSVPSCERSATIGCVFDFDRSN